jgi:hypothetical protein
MAPVLTKHPISDTDENSRDSGKCSIYDLIEKTFIKNQVSLNLKGDHESRKAKRKRSRWGEDTQRAAIPGLLLYFY